GHAAVEISARQIARLERLEIDGLGEIRDRFIRAAQLAAGQPPGEKRVGQIVWLRIGRRDDAGRELVGQNRLPSPESLGGCAYIAEMVRRLSGGRDGLFLREGARRGSHRKQDREG